MKQDNASFDSTWESDIYGQGRHLNRYPFDVVVSFVFKNAPADRARQETRILEIGCGAGNNLWFAAREGFSVTGLDGSSSAIEYAKTRFADEGLAGEFVVGDFTDLPFEPGTFDIVIDRGALTCCGMADARLAVMEVARVLRSGGRFLANPYSDAHGSRLSGKEEADGVFTGITKGSLAGVGNVALYSMTDVKAMFGSEWKLLSVKHLVIEDEAGQPDDRHAEWRVTAEKI